MPLPRAYLCGFPKSGLHMVEQAASAVIAPISTNNWIGTSGWVAKINNYEVLLKALAVLQPGTYAKGHTAHTSQIEQYAWALGISVIFIYRDLRDIVVSQAVHVLNADNEKLKHPGTDLYRELDSFEDVMIAVIEGLGEYDGIFKRWAAYSGWLDSKWVHKVRYEDMRKYDKRECERLAHYLLGDDVDKNIVNAMVARIRNRKGSLTFNRGKVGAWKKSFTPKVKDCFKANDPGWLITLGYAKDNNW